MSVKRLRISLCDIKHNPSEEVLSFCKRSSFCSELFGKPRIVLKRYQIQEENEPGNERSMDSSSHEESGPENERSRHSSSREEENRIYIRKKRLSLSGSDEEGDLVYVKKKISRILESDEEYGADSEGSMDLSFHGGKKNTVHVKKKISRNLWSRGEKKNTVHVKKKISRSLCSRDDNISTLADSGPESERIRDSSFHEESGSENERSRHSSSHEESGPKRRRRHSSSNNEDNQIHSRKKALRTFESEDDDITNLVESGPENKRISDSSFRGGKKNTVHVKRKISRSLRSRNEENRVHGRERRLRYFESDDDNISTLADSGPESERIRDSSFHEESGSENERSRHSSSHEESGPKNERRHSSSHDNDISILAESGPEIERIRDSFPEKPELENGRSRGSSSHEEFGPESETSSDSSSVVTSLDEDCASVSESSIECSTSDVDFAPSSETTEYTSSDTDYSTETENESSEDSAYDRTHLKYEEKIKERIKDRKALVKSLEKSAHDLHKMMFTLKKSIKPVKRKKLLRVGLLPQGSRLPSRRLVKFNDSINFEEKALYLRSLIKTQEAKDDEHKRKQFLQELEKTRKDRIKRHKSNNL